MSHDSRLIDLLVKFEEIRAEGQPVTPEELCPNDAQLLAAFKHHLGELGQLGFFLDEARTPSDQASQDSKGTVDTPGRARPGSYGWRADAASAGRYRPLRFHAKGGLGEVFVARDEELDREVALKRIQAGYVADNESRRRFLREAAITARLEHPGIVPVYGLVEAGDGQPYYAMRFIEGETLQDALRRFHAEDTKPSRDPGERSLAFRNLLDRFVAVCNTMAYAHSRGVLHRDLKPANVMLGPYGETLVVDWGLAKPFAPAGAGSAGEENTPAPAARATDQGGTRTGHTMGTPAYMSPEQAEGRWDVVGPASDVYSLGATLACVLTGRAPASGRPPADKDRARQPGKEIPLALEALCRKAMAPRPEDRYATAAELADEVRHWLAGEPVGAWPEPWTVRAGRWVRRHHTLVTSTAAVLVAAVLLLTGAAILLNLAWGREQQARVGAQTAQKREEAVAAFLMEIFRSPDPRHATRELSITRRLDLAAERLEKEFADDPETRARLFDTLGQTYLGIGQVPPAVAAFEKAVVLRRAALGAEHPDTLASVNNLATAHMDEGHHEKALPLLEEALAGFRARYGPDHQDTLQAMSNLALTYDALGRIDKALPLYEQVLRGMRAVLGPDAQDTLLAQNNLATAYQERDRLPEAQALFEDALKRAWAALGIDHPDTLTVMNNLAELHRVGGRVDQALPLFEDAFKRRQAVLGPDHSDTLNSMNNVAAAYQGLGRLPEALPLFEKALVLRKAKLGPTHADTLNSIANLGAGYFAAGRLAESIPLLEEALKLRTEHLSPEHPDTLFSRSNLAAAYRLAQDPAQVVPFCEKNLDLTRAKHGPEHRETLRAMNHLALAYQAAGRLDDAVPLFEETLKLYKAKLGPDHPDTLVSTNNLASALGEAKRAAEAEALFREALGGLRRLPAGDPLRPTVLLNAGAFFVKQGNLPEAEPLLRDALGFLEKERSEDGSRFLAQSLLGESLAGRKRYAEAESLLLTGYEGMKAREGKIPSAPKRNLNEAAGRLVQLYEAWDKPEKAAEWRARHEELSKRLPKPTPK